MDNLLTLTIEAHHGERNHHRRYEIRVGRDLFEHWTVTILYGRVCQGGHERRYGSPTPDALRVIILPMLAASAIRAPANWLRLSAHLGYPGRRL